MLITLKDLDNHTYLISPRPLGGVLIECHDAEDGQINHTMTLHPEALRQLRKALDLFAGEYS
jgi:hypothetical protein